MRQAFGKIVGTAARIDKGERLFTVYCEVDQAEEVKGSVPPRLQQDHAPCRIKVERGEDPLIA